MRDSIVNENASPAFFKAVAYVERKKALEDAAATQKMFWERMGIDKRKAVNASGISWKSIPKDVDKNGPPLRIRFYVDGDQKSIEIKVVSDGRWQIRNNGTFESWGFCKLAELLMDELLEEGVS